MASYVQFRQPGSDWVLLRAAATALGQLLPGCDFLLDSEVGPARNHEAYQFPWILETGPPTQWESFTDVAFYDIVRHSAARQLVVRAIGEGPLLDLVDDYLATFATGDGERGVGLPHRNPLSAVLAQLVITHYIEATND